MKVITRILMIVILAVVSPLCRGQYARETQSSIGAAAVRGAIVGGVAGAIVGNNSGDLHNDAKRGALLGAGAGALISVVTSKERALPPAGGGRRSLWRDNSAVWERQKQLKWELECARSEYVSAIDQLEAAKARAANAASRVVTLERELGYR